jgi:hypothetical protein
MIIIERKHAFAMLAFYLHQKSGIQKNLLILKRNAVESVGLTTSLKK